MAVGLPGVLVRTGKYRQDALKVGHHADGSSQLDRGRPLAAWAHLPLPPRRALRLDRARSNGWSRVTSHWREPESGGFRPSAGTAIRVRFPLGSRLRMCHGVWWTSTPIASGRRSRRAIRASTDGSSAASRRPGSTVVRAVPARTPKRENVRLFASAAAAQAAGFRACKRCRPDATPGSPEWDLRADLVGRAMRLIADGLVDREGVAGLARRLGYTERHVHRQLVAVAGAGPLALARAQRAQTARILLETTDAGDHRRGVRRRLSERAPVQRDDPRGVRADPQRAAHASAPARAPRGQRRAVAAPALPRAAGRRRPRRIPWAARRRRCRGGSRRRLPAQPAPAARRRRRRAAARRRVRARPLLARRPA